MMLILKAFMSFTSNLSRRKKPMAAAPLDPISVLLQRREFLDGIKEVASLCNWAVDDVEVISDLVWNELVDIDNHMFSVYEETGDRWAAFVAWETKTEELRRWLSLMLGVRIRYI